MSPLVSYILLTCNRRDSLLRTLAILREQEPDDAATEVIVVDNGSEDDTAQAVRHAAPWAKVISRTRNDGAVARNDGIAAAGGAFLVFLDDDSWPLPGTVAAAIGHLKAHPSCALVGGRVELRDGEEDAAAMPVILPACGWVVRRSALEKVGGFSRDLFIRAEEYDVIFRLLAAGHEVHRFEDLHFRHDKTSSGRSAAKILGMDLTNNLILTQKFLPPDLRAVFARDWQQRYAALARHGGCSHVIEPALADAAAWARSYPEGHPPRQMLSSTVIERIFGFSQQRMHVQAWAAATGVQRVIIAGLSKNIHATVEACRAASLEVLSIADDHPAFQGLVVRDLSVEPVSSALERHPGGIVLATINPARVEREARVLRAQCDLPLCTLWKPAYLDEALAPASSCAQWHELPAAGTRLASTHSPKAAR